MGRQHLHIDVIEVDLLELASLLLVEVARGVVDKSSVGIGVHAAEYKEYNWLEAANRFFS